MDSANESVSLVRLPEPWLNVQLALERGMPQYKGPDACTFCDGYGMYILSNPHLQAKGKLTITICERCEGKGH